MPTGVLGIGDFQIVALIKNIARPVFRLMVRFGQFLLSALFCALKILLPEDFYLRARAYIADKACTECSIGGIKFHINHPISYFRAREYLKVEPDLIQWIEDTVDKDSVFYDVGANIGAYSIYVAKKGGRVVAFEPFADNYGLLNKNISINNLDGLISAFNIAVHDKTGTDVLFVSKFDPGGAIHTVAVNRGGSAFEEYRTVHHQSVLTFRLDDFVNGSDLPFPTHVKIDVDGNDHLVLDGMDGFMTDKRLKHIAIEVNPALRDIDRKIPTVMEKYGFQQITDKRYDNPRALSSQRAFNTYYKRVD